MMYVYILTNKNNTTLYVGVTNNLIRRILEHKFDKNNGFSKCYNTHKLVYYEYTDNADDAIYREKCLKRSYRKIKNKLITRMNPNWDDLSEKILSHN